MIVTTFHMLSLLCQGAVIEGDDGERYIYATYASANDPLDVDDLEFLFTVRSRGPSPFPLIFEFAHSLGLHWVMIGFV